MISGLFNKAFRPGPLTFKQPLVSGFSFVSMLFGKHTASALVLLEHPPKKVPRIGDFENKTVSSGLPLAIQQAEGGMLTPHKHYKAKRAVMVPQVTTQVRRITRSNKFDGFKVPAITDVKEKKTKVKARKAPRIVDEEETSDALDNDQLPPPTSVQLL